ncbi:anti-sigma factor domain-containing protein [Nesterenkonia alba]|uniref:anti-sigma factor domain-containing protein n=1 Tax=Nesterenkonia alba TaxID=515814 RepID=UPI0003B572D1|nr:anti-sigma factor [Nesterenkonia alba]
MTTPAGGRHPEDSPDDAPEPVEPEATGWEHADLQHASGEYPEADDVAGDPDSTEPTETEDDEAEGEAPDLAALPENPTLADLLTGTARGHSASFSAFYEATSDVVYGLTLLMHATAEGAAAATTAVYQHLWDQADARARDLRVQTQTSQLLTDEFAGPGPQTTQAQDASPADPSAADQTAGEDASYRPNEYELVLEWLVPLVHRIVVERFREGLAEPIPLSPVPQNQGGGVAGLPEEVIEDLIPLSDSQVQALALTYLTGQTHQQVAETVGAAIPSVKSRLRDAMARLHAARTEREAEPDPILRAAVTKDDVTRGSGVNRNFTPEIAADLDKGLLTELAELYALDAIDDRERALLEEAALTASADQAQQWDTRVLAARRTLAEIFAAHPVPPPSGLLDEILGTVAESQQEVGMSMVESFGAETEETERQKPKAKRWMLVAGFLAVVAIGAVVIWGISRGQDTQAIAEADENAVVIEGHPMHEGGEIHAVISAEEDVAFVEFSDVPDLENENATYQLWLLPVDDSLPSSLGNFTPEELEEEGVDIHNIAQYQYLQVTVEQIRGEERPTGESVADLPLQEGLPEDPDDA